MSRARRGRVYYVPAPGVDGVIRSVLPGARPLSARIETPAVVVATATPGALRTAAGAQRAHAGVGIVAVLPPGRSPDGLAANPAVHGYCAADAPAFVVRRAVASALRLARLELEHAEVRADASRLTADLHRLSQIGIRLSSEHHLETLLELILTGARELTSSDAGSLYLVEPDGAGGTRLRFTLAQNDSVRVPFVESILPITSDSVAGHVALTGEPLRLADAYAPPRGARFHINRAFDRRLGYRTKSMLVVPMRTTTGETVGVVQLINRAPEFGKPFPSPAAIERDALPYSAESEGLAASLASQAAVAVENARLYRSVRNLFEGFVRASVTAIESRDPSTFGHSFRVAGFTLGLARVVDRLDSGPYAGVHFTAEQLRELRYASLLHDFGKVGVPEHVLLKPKKLPVGQVELIRERIALFKTALALRHAERRIDDAELAAGLRRLDGYLEAILAANEPHVLAVPVAAALGEMRGQRFEDGRGVRPVLTEEEARILSIPRGSLTDEERRQVQEHVVHTFRFLSEMPWTDDLRRVADIARSHHEKIDGSGYPLGLGGGEIPVQSRMMTIADIYDALTAADRPYKRAIAVPDALDILRAEARSGTIDTTLLDVFVESRVFAEAGAGGPAR